MEASTSLKERAMLLIVGFLFLHSLNARAELFTSSADYPLDSVTASDCRQAVSTIFLARSSHETPPPAMGFLTPPPEAPWRWYHHLVSREPWRWYHRVLSPFAFPFWTLHNVFQFIPRLFRRELRLLDGADYTLFEAPVRWLSGQPLRIRRWFTWPFLTTVGLAWALTVEAEALQQANQLLVEQPAILMVEQQIEENAPQWDDDIQKKFLYSGIKARLDLKKITVKEARQEAFMLSRALDSYQKGVAKNAQALADPEIWQELLPSILYQKTRKLFENKALSAEQKAELIRLNHSRWIGALRIDHWLTKWSERDKDSMKNEDWLNYVTGQMLERKDGKVVNQQHDHAAATFRGDILILGPKELGGRGVLTVREMIYWLQYEHEAEIALREQAVSGAPSGQRTMEEVRQEIVGRIRVHFERQRGKE